MDGKREAGELIIVRPWEREALLRNTARD